MFQFFLLAIILNISNAQISFTDCGYFKIYLKKLFN